EAIPRWRTQEAGKLPDSVAVHLRSEVDSAATETLQMARDELAQRFVAVLPDVQESMHYRIEGGGAASPRHRVIVVDPPEIMAAELRATPPGYTGKEPLVIDGASGRIRVFERSAVEIHLTMNKPVPSARMIWDSWIPITADIPQDEFEEAAVEERSFVPPGDGVVMAEVMLQDQKLNELVFRFEARGSGRFHFELNDADGLSVDDHTLRELVVTEDLPPRLEVSGIRDQMSIRPDDIVPLDAVASDDVGLGTLELHYQVNEGDTLIVPASGLRPGDVECNEQFRLPLRKLNLANGDSITLLIRATDQRPDPWPNRTEQGPWRLSIADDAPPIGQEPLSEADQQTVDDLRAIAERLKEDGNTAAGLAKDAVRNWNPEEKRQTTNLSEKEQQQGQQLQQIAEEISQHPLMQQQSRDVRDIGSQVRDEVGSELRAAASADSASAAEQLQQSSEQLEQLAAQLGQAADEFERIARVEQELAELNRLALDAEQLAKDADQLQQDRERGAPTAEQTPQEYQEQLSEQSRQLATDRDQLEQDLNNLLERQNELRTAAQQSQLEQMQQLAQEAEQLASLQEKIAEGARSQTAAEPPTTPGAAEMAAELMQEAERAVSGLRQQTVPQSPEDPGADSSEASQGETGQTPSTGQQQQQQLQEQAAEAL
ncbi:MAG: hypothetical protein KDA85_01635, partial [Planctomycetaceae bacterium]|nr:hypothetical protein [Planctomycetaceae bacterium]